MSHRKQRATKYAMPRKMLRYATPRNYTTRNVKPKRSFSGLETVLLRAIKDVKKKLRKETLRAKSKPARKSRGENSKKKTNESIKDIFMPL